MKQYVKVDFLLLGTFLGASLVGCGGSSNHSSASDITLQPRSVLAMATNGLRATMTEDTDVISQGSTVNFTLALTNPTSQPVTIQLDQDCGPHDPQYPDCTLTLTDPKGLELHALGAVIGPPCTIIPPAIQTIVPGQTLTTQVSVGGTPADSQFFGTKGIYTVQALFVTSQSDSTLVGPLMLTVQ